MEHSKTSGGRRFFNTVLILIDLALLAWILFSWYGQKKSETTEGYPVNLGYDAGGYSEASGWDDSSYQTSSGVGMSGDNGMADNMGIDAVSGNPDSWFLGAGDSAQDSGQSTADPLSYSTTERPESADFQLWYEHNITGSIPTGARTITDFGEIQGTWKGLFRYSGSDASAELLNLTVSGTPSSASLLVDWYLIAYAGDGEWLNEEDMGDITYSGTWSDGVLTVSGAGSITIGTFYEYDGQQYAYGEMAVPDGSTALLGMIRP